MQIPGKVKPDFLQAWQAFNDMSQRQLPSAHFLKIHYLEKKANFLVSEGIKIKKLSESPGSCYSFAVTQYNPLLLKAASALLIAESLVVFGKIYW